jgi:hypothetical protein
MSGARTNGPTLAIAAGAPVTNTSASVPTSFNNTGAMNTNNNYVSKMFITFNYYIKFFFFLLRILHH